MQGQKKFRKKGNMLSGVIGRHQIRDDRRYIPRRTSHVTVFVEKDCYKYNRKQKHLVIKKTTIGDVISETCQEELLLIALTHTLEEQQQTNTVIEDNVQVTNSSDEVEATRVDTYAEAEVENTDTESTSKPKSNKWKWAVGSVLAGTGLADIIAYVFKKN